MTYQEIIDELKKQEVRPQDFAYGDVGDYKTNLIENIGKVELEIERHGGEDEGSDWWRIHHFPEHDVYIKVSGWYQSHYGTDFAETLDECCSQVKPVLKTVTIFE